MRKDLQKRIIRVAKVLEKLSGNSDIDIKLTKHDWIQIAGDKHPGKNGVVLARSDGNDLELLEIQSVLSTVGAKKALGVGFPFWTTTAVYNLEDLQSQDAVDAVEKAGLTKELSSMSPEKRAFAVADSLLGYGINEKEGPSGWAKDVVPGKVKWFGSNQPEDWKFLVVMDEKFQKLINKNKHD